ncbi:cytochrome c oxidase cbb3-type subunit IV [Burkholderiales bacterium]|nr:cytochrome c oxidase cbb3-type subunit IV [Burkholderiales bacterium]
MDIISVLGSATTVVAFVAFVGIVAWAYSGRRKRAFDEAANAPFALPDDGGKVPAPRARSTERQP